MSAEQEWVRTLNGAHRKCSTFVIICRRSVQFNKRFMHINQLCFLFVWPSIKVLLRHSSTSAKVFGENIINQCRSFIFKSFKRNELIRRPARKKVLSVEYFHSQTVYFHPVGFALSFCKQILNGIFGLLRFFFRKLCLGFQWLRVKHI